MISIAKKNEVIIDNERLLDVLGIMSKVRNHDER
tara:strand:- start:78 stop:179 length:102 start_codon:yes stop_codon:yes gene_type:complete